jgi:hypothetical protein
MTDATTVDQYLPRQTLRIVVASGDRETAVRERLCPS